MSRPDDARPRRTLRLGLSFDGTGFAGWQRQVGARTVQETVEAALAGILGTPHTVIGSGRTDAGTHARQMVVSLRTDHAMSVAELARALDAVLPPDVGVLDLGEAPAEFHARRDAVWKWYRYRLLASATRRPLLERRALRRRRLPPLAALAAAARVLEGRHDFAAFANAGTPVTSTVRTLHALRWKRLAVAADPDVPPGEAPDGTLLCLDAVGDGFLYKMVRTLVGTLLAAAREADPPGWVRRVLESGDRRCAGPAVPARGLTLMAVAVRGEPVPKLPAGLWPGHASPPGHAARDPSSPQPAASPPSAPGPGEETA